MGSLVRRKKTWRYSAWKMIEFGQLLIDILDNVSCTFKMYIFEIVKVITEHVCIAFLFVLNIMSLFSFQRNQASSICFHFQ